MKILICHQYYLQRGGEDGVFENEVSWLRSQGHEVLAFEAKHSSNRLVRALEACFSCLGISRYHYQLKKALKLFSPDLVRFHNVFPLLTLRAFNSAKKSGAKTEWVLHNYRSLCLNATLFRSGRLCTRCPDEKSFFSGIRYSCYRNSAVQSILAAMAWRVAHLCGYFKAVDRFVCLSESSKRLFIQYGFDSQKISVLRNRVEPVFMPEGASKLYDFVFAGRLACEKGPQLILALAKLYPRFSFAMAGSGPLEEELKKQSQNLSNFMMLGFLEKKELLDLFSKSTATVCGSLWYELCPLSILESLAVGTPVISTNLGGQAELVRLLNPGLVFDSKDLSTFLPAAEMVQDPIRRAQLSIASKDLIAKINREWRTF